jgi:hypothetical protein
MNTDEKRAASFIAEIDQAELAVRLIERGCHMKRPAGTTGAVAWEQFEAAADDGRVPAYIVNDFLAMARIAIEYFGGCIEAGQRRN